MRAQVELKVDGRVITETGDTDGECVARILFKCYDEYILPADIQEYRSINSNGQIDYGYETLPLFRWQLREYYQKRRNG